MAQIRLSITIDASPEKIYPLIATAHGFSQWWASDVTESGGAVDLGFFQRSTIYRLQLTLSAAPMQAEWRCLTGQEWDGTRLLFDLKPNNGKTLVSFAHADWKADTDYFVSCTTTWGELIVSPQSSGGGQSARPAVLH